VILAEIKVNDGEEWQTKLYNCSYSQFRSMANKRFVAVGKTLELPTGTIIDFLRERAGWKEVKPGEYLRPKHY
jgi:hypothetical protein